MREIHTENVREMSHSGVWNKVQSFEYIERMEDISDVLILLSDINMLRYFKYNIEEYCEIIGAILQKIENENLYLDILNYEGFLPEVIQEQDLFPTNFLNKTVFVLIEKCFAMKENTKLVDLTTQIIQKSLFSKTHRNLDCFINYYFNNKKCTEDHTFCKKLFTYLVSLYSQEDLGNFGFKLICESCFKQFKNFDKLYKMLIILIDMMGIELKETFNLPKMKYSVAVINVNQSLQIIKHLSDILSTTKIDLEHEVNNVTFSAFIKNVCRSIMVETKTPHRHCYRICINFIQISPLLVECVIDEIITYFMLNDNSENAKDYEDLLLKVFETYNRLHRIQSLIYKIIMLLSSKIDKNAMDSSYVFKIDVGTPRKEQPLSVDNILPLSVLNYFVECIIYLASWQTINLFKTLLFHLDKAVEDLNDNTEDKPNRLFYIETLSTLTCWVLLSVRMAEHFVASATVEKFTRGFIDLRTTLSKFGTIILQKEHCHILMRTFLNLCFYWGELYIIIERYLVPNKVELWESMEYNNCTTGTLDLFSYISDEDWGLLSERVNNFGDKPCKNIMNKLILQKLKTLVILDDIVTEECTNFLIKELSLNIDKESIGLFEDSFFITYVFEKMTQCNIIKVGEVFLQQLLSGNSTIMKYDSGLVIHSIICVWSTKINSFLKQKRKHNKNHKRKSIYRDVFSNFPRNMLLNCEESNNLLDSVQILLFSEHIESIDLKSIENELQMYLEVLEKLPIIFCSTRTQNLMIILLLAFHKDINSSNCTSVLKNTCERLIIGIVQHNKTELLHFCEAGALLKFIDQYFDRRFDVFQCLVNHAFKSVSTIARFETGIYFIENMKEDRCLVYAVNVLNYLNKFKKQRLAPKSKTYFVSYRSVLCSKIINYISEVSPEEKFVQPYAVVLKTMISTEDKNISKVMFLLNDYVYYCLKKLYRNNVKGFMLLFGTILRTKTLLEKFDSNFVLEVWRRVKLIPVSEQILDDYSQLVMSISVLLATEQFEEFLDDLIPNQVSCTITTSSQELKNNLKTWTSIVTTNFNFTKTTVLRAKLETLLQNLLTIIKCDGTYAEDLFKEILQLEVSIIQAHHVPLTASIMDFLLLTVSILMEKQLVSFIVIFNLCISIMENLLKYRNLLIMDRLPPYLLQYRLLLKKLCHHSSSKYTLHEKEVQQVSDCAHKLEKITKILVECTKDMSRIALYLIADILGCYEQDIVYPTVKKHLNNCIYSLMSLCDIHAIQYFMRSSSNATTEIFRIMYDNYKKYRFTGKV